MMFSAPSAFCYPTTTQIFEVPISRPAMMLDSSNIFRSRWRWRRRWFRLSFLNCQPLQQQPSGEQQQAERAEVEIKRLAAGIQSRNERITGAQLALRNQDAAHAMPKAKCPFTLQREMVLNF